MQEIRDFKKRTAKSWQEKNVLRHIRKCYPKKRILVAIGIYTILTEVSSNCNSERFQASQKTFAEMAGVSYSTIRRYLNEFITLKILKKEYRKKGEAYQANIWTLLEALPMTFTSVQDSEQTSKQGIEQD